MCCVQWEQPAGCEAFDTAEIRDKLTGALIGLARATEGNDHMVSDSTAAVVVEGLCATLPNGDFDNEALLAIMDKVDGEKRRLVPECYQCASSCGRTSNYDMRKLWKTDEDVRKLKFSILSGIRGIAAHVYHGGELGYKDDSVHQLLYKALFAIGMDDWETEELLPILQEVDKTNEKFYIRPEHGSYM